MTIRKMNKIATLAVIYGLCSVAATAEPWVASRYAQNCSGCHAPGRKNLPMINRRCTLSCQGCHVSPNGGGIRSYFGKWNENKWLRSAALLALGADKPVAPLRQQQYGRKNNLYKKGKKTPKGGFPLVELKQFITDEQEALYDRRDGLERIEATRKEFEYQIPRTDPYRLMDLGTVDAGGDFRYQLRQKSVTVTNYDSSGSAVGDPSESEAFAHWPMALDAGVGIRPFHRKLRFVYEVRALAPPPTDRPSTDPDLAASTIKRRSLYAMIDDLPYNLYLMGGYYRPLFGYYTPDHTFLPQLIQNSVLGTTTYNQEYFAYSIGGSPNVPYFNLHYIVRQTNGGSGINRNLSGYVANVGARWVTLGLSANLSYWSTKDTTDGDNPSTLDMFSLYGSMQVWRLTLALDLQSISKTNIQGTPDASGQTFYEDRSGGVYSFDSYLQLWRAIYGHFQFAYSNSAKDLSIGNATQIRLGLRTFMMQGTELSIHYQIEDETSEDRTKAKSVIESTGYVMQLHFFI